MLELHTLRLDGRIDLSQVASDRLHLAHAAQRAAQVAIPTGWVSMWLPLRGELRFESAWGAAWTLARSQLLISNEGPLQATSDASATWLLVAGTHAAWHQRLAQVAAQPGSAELLMRQHPCSRDIRHPLVRLARLLRDGNDAYDFALGQLCRAVLADQRELLALADRCNGRTPQRRVLTLQRLLRVRHLIERNDDGTLDLAQLASRASYSPWHLIRSYRDVFGETPSEHLSRLRLARAWALVRESGLPVCDITEKLGFESQSAFCRAFKNAYGVTTTQARHLPAHRACVLRHGRTRSTHSHGRRAQVGNGST